MQITERKLENYECIKGGHQADVKIVRLNGVEYKFEVIYKRHHYEEKLYVNGEEVAIGCDASNTFAQLTGIDTMQFEIYLGKIKWHRMSPCCKKNAHWVKGFPGEELLLCSVCNKVHDTSFHFSEII